VTDPLDPDEITREWSGEITPLKSVEGTFSGAFDSMPPEWVGDGTEIREMFFYGPDMTVPRWRRWFWRIREAIGGEPYPTILLASGPARLDVSTEEPVPGVVLVTGGFTRTGEWWVDPSLRDPDAEGKSR